MDFLLIAKYLASLIFYLSVFSNLWPSVGCENDSPILSVKWPFEKYCMLENPQYIKLNGSKMTETFTYK